MQTQSLLFLILLVVVLAVLEIILVLRKRRKFKSKDIALIRSEWGSITEKIEIEPKHALIEADRLLDYVLKKMGYEGTLGEKIVKAAKLFCYYEEVWRVHKLRNKAVHEMGFKLNKEQIKRALSIYKQAIWDLGIKL